MGISNEGISAKDEYLRAIEGRVAAFYDGKARDYEAWLARQGYYYERQQRIVRHVLPSPGTVLEVGCGLGQNLAALGTTSGLGIDLSAAMVEEARRRYPVESYPQLSFRQMSAMDCDQLEGRFDTILLVNSLTEIPDPVAFFKKVRSLCAPHTRIFQMSYNFLWEPILKAAAPFRLTQGHPVQNWFSRLDYENVFRLAGFEIVREGRDLLVPKGPRWFCDPLNRLGGLCPGVRALSMMYYCVARPVGLEQASDALRTTVVIPCRNEVENVPGMVARIPEMGAGTEIVFVDDASTDGTADAVEAEMATYPDREVHLVRGPGEGKGAAVRAGLAKATGDVYIILDADLTVMPEALPEFVDALVSGKGEFINGSRLVYPMETEAMRNLNVWGNKLFAHLLSMIISQRIKDTLCGTKAIWSRDYAKVLETRSYFGEVDRWGDYDWIFGAARNNLRIVELPVHYRERVAGQTKMTRRLWNAWIMLAMCWRAFWRLKIV